MPEKKLYMIVTNDEYETPIQLDLIGAKAVAEYIGITVQSVRHKIHRNNWGKKLKYKAVECGYYEFDKQEYTKIYGITHDRKEYYRQYYQKTKSETLEKRKQYMKQYREVHKEELNEYLRNYRKRRRNESIC